MDILIFEWMVGGGLLQNRIFAAPENPLFQEGLAMVSPICSDLASAGHSIHLPVDFRLPRDLFCGAPLQLHPVSEFGQLAIRLNQLGSRSEAILVIAPESEGRLATALDWLASHDDRILSPHGDIVRIGSSKNETIRLLESTGVQKAFNSHPDHPILLKPDDGAGSEGIRIVGNTDAIPKFILDQPGKWRVEPFLPGLPVSISVMGGPHGYFLLPPTEQVFQGAPFALDAPPAKTPDREWPRPWVGFNYPIGRELSVRAVDLCNRALNALPKFTGCLGMDMILAESGANDDRIVDLNPRMTSSWAGLRQLHTTNLAEFMIHHARGIESEAPVVIAKALRFRLNAVQKKGPA